MVFVVGDRHCDGLPRPDLLHLGEEVVSLFLVAWLIAEVSDHGCLEVEGEVSLRLVDALLGHGWDSLTSSGHVWTKVLSDQLVGLVWALVHTHDVVCGLHDGAKVGPEEYVCGLGNYNVSEAFVAVGGRARVVDDLGHVAAPLADESLVESVGGIETGVVAAGGDEVLLVSIDNRRAWCVDLGHPF